VSEQPTKGRPGRRPSARCFFADQCPICHLCEDFTPIDDAGEDVLVKGVIERGRKEFCKEWFQYIKGWD